MNNRPFIPKRSANTSLFSYRLKSRLNIIKDKYLNWVQLSKLFVPLILFFGLLPAIIVFITYTSYEKRIVTSSDQIPSELREVVMFINYEDVNNNPDLIREFAQKVSELYISQKIDHVYVFSISINKNLFPVKNTILEFFKDIPTDKLDVDVVTKDEFDICQKAKDTYQLNKFILMSYHDSLIRLGYRCNAINLYTLEYLPDNLLNSYSGSDTFMKTLDTIVRSGFN